MLAKAPANNSRNAAMPSKIGYSDAVISNTASSVKWLSSCSRGDVGVGGGASRVFDAVDC